MTRTISIEGMSCGHCINWITEALKKIDGVENAKVSLEDQNAVVRYDEGKVTERMISETLERQGYKALAFS